MVLRSYTTYLQHHCNQDMPLFSPHYCPNYSILESLIKRTGSASSPQHMKVKEVYCPQSLVKMVSQGNGQVSCLLYRYALLFSPLQMINSGSHHMWPPPPLLCIIITNTNTLALQNMRRSVAWVTLPN